MARGAPANRCVIAVGGGGAFLAPRKCPYAFPALSARALCAREIGFVSCGAAAASGNLFARVHSASLGAGAAAAAAHKRCAHLSLPHQTRRL